MSNSQKEKKMVGDLPELELLPFIVNLAEFA
jgi:hypothetical protein